MFVPVKTDTGTVSPWEYLPAEAGDYVAGQILETASGLVSGLTATLNETPVYLCMAEKKIETEGELLPVTRIRSDAIYESELDASSPSVEIGSKLSVDSTGLTVADEEGAFEVTWVDATDEGAPVRGRFLPGVTKAAE